MNLWHSHYGICSNTNLGPTIPVNDPRVSWSTIGISELFFRMVVYFANPTSTAKDHQLFKIFQVLTLIERHLFTTRKLLNTQREYLASILLFPLAPQEWFSFPHSASVSFANPDHLFIVAPPPLPPPPLPSPASPTMIRVYLPLLTELSAINTNARRRYKFIFSAL